MHLEMTPLRYNPVSFRLLQNYFMENIFSCEQTKVATHCGKVMEKPR